MLNNRLFIIYKIYRIRGGVFSASIFENVSYIKYICYILYKIFVILHFG